MQGMQTHRPNGARQILSVSGGGGFDEGRVRDGDLRDGDRDADELTSEFPEWPSHLPIRRPEVLEGKIQN
ncbi:hypothetical protein CCP2SC5_530014 [Azospirillaceae bacterium]